MADYNKVYFLDAGDNPATMQFPVAASPADIDGFCALYSNAGLVRAVKVEAQTVTETSPDNPSNVDHAVKCLFQLGQEKIQFSLLAPNETGEVKHNLGRVLTAAEKSLLLADWKTVEGLSGAYTLRRNRFLQRR